MQRSKYELFQSYFPYVTHPFTRNERHPSALLPCSQHVPLQPSFFIATNQDMRFCRGRNFFKPLFLHFLILQLTYKLNESKFIEVRKRKALDFSVSLCNFPRKFTFPYQLIRFKPYQQFVALVMYIIQVARDTLRLSSPIGYFQLVSHLTRIQMHVTCAVFTPNLDRTYLSRKVPA